MTKITTPDELFEFLDFDTTKPGAAGLASELCRAIYDCSLLSPDEIGEEGPDELDRLCLLVDKICPKISLGFHLCETPGSIRFYKLMLSPAGGFNENTILPDSWEIWDDETDYSDPRVEVDTTPPEPDDCELPLGKLGVLVFQPDVVDAFQKAAEASDNP